MLIWFVKILWSSLIFHDNASCRIVHVQFSIHIANYIVLNSTLYEIRHVSCILTTRPCCVVILKEPWKEPVVITFRAPQRPKRFFHPMSNATNVVISWCSWQFWKCLVLSVFIWEYHLRFELVSSHHYFDSGVQIAQVSRHFDKGCMSSELIVIITSLRNDIDIPKSCQKSSVEKSTCRSAWSMWRLGFFWTFGWFTKQSWMVRCRGDNWSIVRGPHSIIVGTNDTFFVSSSRIFLIPMTHTMYEKIYPAVGSEMAG